MKHSLNRVQLTLLDMAKETARILEKHSIPYMLAFGSLLGAVRHKGFIPWDEDIDFFLVDDSYDAAKDYLRNELPSKYFLEDEKSEPKYFHSYAHVKDLNSIVTHVLYPHDDCYEHKGLSLDLYLLHKIELRNLWPFINNENRRYINRRKEVGLMSNEEYDSRLKKIEEAEMEAKKNPIISNETIYAYPTPHKCNHLPEDVIFPLKIYDFEDTCFYGMNNADWYLTAIYGDYMKLPAEDERVGGHDFVRFLD